MTPDTTRLDLWTAISDLFLDTEVRVNAPFVAVSCVQSGYDEALLEHVLVHEVARVLGQNLIQVAGEWAMFPRDYLAKALREVSRPVSRLRRMLAKAYVVPWDDWRLAMAFVPQLRELPVEQRLRRARGLAWCVDAYITEPKRLFIRSLTDAEEPVETLVPAFYAAIAPLGHAAVLRGGECFTEDASRSWLEMRMKIGRAHV